MREPAAPLYRGHAVVALALVQLRRVVRRLHAALPDGGDDHLRDPGDRAAARRLVVLVRGGAGEEHRDGHHAEQRRDAVAEAPADAGLHPHEHGAADERADVDGHVEPVEEGALAGALRLVGLVELARPERHEHRLQRAAEREQVEARVEGGALQRRRRARREHRVGGDGDDEEERDGPVPAEEGVGEEGGDERRDGARAQPVGDAVGGGLAPHVQPVLEVVHQVRRHGEVGRVLEAVVRW